MRHALITPEEMADLEEIDRLLDEANNHAYDNDGIGKSSEGNISVDLGNHWDRDPEEPRKPVQVTIYAYMLGPHRSHYFDSTAQALEVVRTWHRNEMGRGDGSGFDYQDDPYTEIEHQRQAAFERRMAEFDRWHEGEN